MGEGGGSGMSLQLCACDWLKASQRLCPGAMIIKHPSPGDKILIYRPECLQLVLGGAQTLEIRGRPFRSGTYYLGSQSQIYAQARLGRAFPIHTMRDFARTKHQHRMGCTKLPYLKTFAIPILEFAPLFARFHHPRGAITIVRYRSV